MSDTCPAEMHAHIDGECLGLLAHCVREAGHRPQDWHKSVDAPARVEWNYDHREDGLFHQGEI